MSSVNKRRGPSAINQKSIRYFIVHMYIRDIKF